MKPIPNLLDYLQFGFQTLFWIVIAAVAVLTYVGARKTILQPIRTEVFKAQIAELSKIMALFVGKDEIELRDSYGFETMFLANTVAMYDAYAVRQLGAEIVDRNERPYSRTKCPSSILTNEYAEKHLMPLDGHSFDATVSHRPIEPWSAYIHGEIHLPAQHTAAQKVIAEILESPLLPRDLATLLEQFLERLDDNTHLLGQLLTECATEMPHKYSTRQALEKGSFAWIHSRYNSQFTHLKPGAEGIVSFIRRYYQTDRLMRP